MPAFVGMYRDEMSGSVAKKRQVLAALRKFFDVLVERHFVQLNPARSTDNPKERLEEGKTPLLPLSDAEKLLASIDLGSVVGRRDFAVIAILISTGCRIGAVEKLRREDLFYDRDQWYVRLKEKRSKVRVIPVRHDLQGPFLDYLEAADLVGAPPKHHVFRAAMLRTGTFRPYTPDGENGVRAKGHFRADDMGRMLKRRLCDIGVGEKRTVATMVKGKAQTRTVYTSRYSAHGFRVAVTTDLLDQGKDTHDVAYLLGHASTRTTQLYQRGERKVKRNLIESIRVNIPEGSEKVGELTRAPHYTNQRPSHQMS